MDRVVYFAARRETDGSDGQVRSATLALPACHASATADVYVFTVRLFYWGLEQAHKESNHEKPLPWINHDSTETFSSMSIYAAKAITVT